jgi:hypothetical protein
MRVYGRLLSRSPPGGVLELGVKGKGTARLASKESEQLSLQMQTLHCLKAHEGPIVLSLELKSMLSVSRSGQLQSPQAAGFPTVWRITTVIEVVIYHCVGDDSRPWWYLGGRNVTCVQDGVGVLISTCVQDSVGVLAITHFANQGVLMQQVSQRMRYLHILPCEWGPRCGGPWPTSRPRRLHTMGTLWMIHWT